MSAPGVSVIVPVHNGETYLAAALASIRAQDYAPLEIIVVDDGSTDHSAAVAAAVAGVRVLAQPCRGPAAARNAGVRSSRGEIVAFNDQDDLWRPGKLRRQVEALLAEPAAGVTFAAHRWFLAGGGPAPAWVREGLLERDHAVPLPGTLLVRRWVFERVGYFDESIISSSDVEWYLRCVDLGIGAVALPDVLLDKRVHSANHSADVAVCHEGLLAAVRRSIARKRGAEQPPGDGGAGR